MADARAGVEGIRLGGLEAAPFVGVTNLLDEEYNTSVTVNAFRFNANAAGRVFEPGPPRTRQVCCCGSQASGRTRPGSTPWSRRWASAIDSLTGPASSRAASSSVSPSLAR